MPRALRTADPGALYHVMHRGDHREPIFRSDSWTASDLFNLSRYCKRQPPTRLSRVRRRFFGMVLALQLSRAKEKLDLRGATIRLPP